VTHPITQAEALGASPLGPGERARFFSAARFDALDCLTARFSTHAYAPHTHETYAVGTIVEGCETYVVRGVRYYSGPGDVVFMNPLEVHDGAPLGAGYSYRMSYPQVATVLEAAEAVTGRAPAGTPAFRDPVARDPEGAALFGRAHAALQAGTDGLAGEELLLRAYARMVALHARLSTAPLAREHAGVARVREAIEARYAEDLSLDMLAREAGLSRHHLIRAFRREVGLTPHAYVLDVRVRRARERLKRGESPADVAAATGFADQAHLSRCFKARLGVGPGAYRKAVM
jgi:AraC-like DNA-binding protein